MSFWTDERTDHLIKRWGEGASGADIAKELGGISRNGVIGKVHRLDLPKRSQDAARAASKINGRARSAAPRPPSPRIVAPAVNPNPQEPSPKRLKKWAEAAVAPRPWLEREFGECAAPVGGEGADTLSCCNPCAKRASWAYCDSHLALMQSKTGEGAGWSEARKEAARHRMRITRAQQRAAA